MSYVFDAKRYDRAQFRRCGLSGIVLPPVSLGLWQNIGGVDVFETGRAVSCSPSRNGSHLDRTLAGSMGHRTGRPRRTSGRFCERIFTATEMSS